MSECKEGWYKDYLIIPIVDKELGIKTFEGGGHVGIYIAEDKDCYHVLGGNQSDAVTITRISKKRCFGIRRPKYNSQPEAVAQYLVSASGEVSKNEA